MYVIKFAICIQKWMELLSVIKGPWTLNCFMYGVSASVHKQRQQENVFNQCYQLLTPNFTTLNAKCILWKILPYSDKRKQLLKMKFLVNEQNVSVMYIDINAISL